jgi:hypothetical protein
MSEKEILEIFKRVLDDNALDLTIYDFSYVRKYKKAYAKAEKLIKLNKTK